MHPDFEKHFRFKFLTMPFRRLERTGYAFERRSDSIFIVRVQKCAKCCRIEQGKDRTQGRMDLHFPAVFHRDRYVQGRKVLGLKRKFPVPDGNCSKVSGVCPSAFAERTSYRGARFPRSVCHAAGAPFRLDSTPSVIVLERRPRPERISNDSWHAPGASWGITSGVRPRTTAPWRTVAPVGPNPGVANRL